MEILYSLSRRKKMCDEKVNILINENSSVLYK